MSCTDSVRWLPMRVWHSLLLVTVGLSTSACSDPPRDQPLVVVLLVDTLRRDSLSCYGSARPTPAIDRLAAEGARFEQAIASSGWTLPSAASLLTGVAPPVHQARGKNTRLTPISPDVRTGAEVLAAAGVRTLAFTNAAFVNPLLELTRGFEFVSHHHAYNHEIRRADATIDAALAKLAEDDARPTLCLIHLFDPHLDYDPPGEYAKLYAAVGARHSALQWKDCSQVLPGQREAVTPEHAARVRAAYDAEIAFVDAEIGRLLVELERRGDLARATIVLTADHGEEFWEHGAFEHGHSLYDELVRVPLVLRTPAAAPGQVLDLPVRTLDLMPTLCELFGVPPSPQFEGRSLLPVLRGEDREPRPVVLDGTLYGHDKVALRTERHKLILDRNPASERALELFDWVADPLERTNLAAGQPELAERLRMELEARLALYATQAKELRPGELIDLSPEKQAEILEQLDALGYGSGGH